MILSSGLSSSDATHANFWITAVSRILIAVVVGVIYRVARSPRRSRER